MILVTVVDQCVSFIRLYSQRFLYDGCGHLLRLTQPAQSSTSALYCGHQTELVVHAGDASIDNYWIRSYLNIILRLFNINELFI